jgi:uncharacterized protein (TIGR02118 family)
MYKVVACWTAPKSGEEDDFEQAYWDSHIPKAAAVPGLSRLVLTRTDVGLEGSEPAFYRVAEMIFDSPEALEEAEHSEEWRKLREDAGVMIERFGVSLNVGIGAEAEHALTA